MSKLAYGILLVIGLATIGTGFVMPGDGVRTVDVCISDREPPELGENCPTVTAERYVENDLKTPLVIGGGVLTLVGGVLALSRE